MSYKERVDRVIDFIGKHLDEELELDELCPQSILKLLFKPSK